MNALNAFMNHEQQLLESLAAAKSPEEAAKAAVLALEQTACTLAQDEQDEHARQRQQAVMALARRAPQLLRAADARGEMVLGESGKADKRRQMAKNAGMFLLSALAVYEVIAGRPVFAALQLAGAGLLMFGGVQAAPAQAFEARGVAQMDGGKLARMLRELCQAADICVSDLALLDQDVGAARLSGTADEAMLDLLTALMEAKASGRDALAMRSLSQAEQYLHMLGVELISYAPEHAQLFDILPTMGEARTIRPAMVKDGAVVRRGVAALQMERGVGA